MVRLMISAALFGTNAIQDLLLALSITPVGVCLVSMLLESSFLALLGVGINNQCSSPYVCIRLGSPGGLGSTYCPFRDRNVLLLFPFSGVLPISRRCHEACLYFTLLPQMFNFRCNFQNPFLLTSPGSPARN